MVHSDLDLDHFGSDHLGQMFIPGLNRVKSQLAVTHSSLNIFHF